MEGSQRELTIDDVAGWIDKLLNLHELDVRIQKAMIALMKEMAERIEVLEDICEL